MMTVRRHFPLHNNEPELIDYFASPLGISKSICPAGVEFKRGRTSSSHLRKQMPFALHVAANEYKIAKRCPPGLVSKIRDCVPPSRNGLSHANRNRDAGMAEKLFWEVLAHLNEISPNFRIQGRRYCALPRRFKRMIHVVDSTTIQLIANCLDWAKHRRRKAAAKMHLRLDLRSFLPNFILVKTAGTHDSAEAPALCVGINEGEIVIFDKAYVDFKHLWRLSQRGVFWITRAKDNMKYDVVGQHSSPLFPCNTCCCKAIPQVVTILIAELSFVCFVCQRAIYIVGAAFRTPVCLSGESAGNHLVPVRDLRI